MSWRICGSRLPRGDNATSKRAIKVSKMLGLWNCVSRCSDRCLFVAELVESAVPKCFETVASLRTFLLLWKWDSSSCYASFETISMGGSRGMGWRMIGHDQKLGMHVQRQSEQKTSTSVDLIFSNCSVKLSNIRDTSLQGWKANKSSYYRFRSSISHSLPIDPRKDRWQRELKMGLTFLREEERKTMCKAVEKLTYLTINHERLIRRLANEEDIRNLFFQLHPDFLLLFIYIYNALYNKCLTANSCDW